MNNFFNKKKGFTVLFTGLSASGKSTLAEELQFHFEDIGISHITLLDGDVVRENLSKGLTFSKEDRIENIRRIAFVSSEIVKHGGVVICSAIAPFEESRIYFRKKVEQHGSFFEVHVSTPLNVCEKRDPKGLYAKARKGEIKNFTGIDDVYEEPKNPDVKIDTSVFGLEEAVQFLINQFNLIGSL